MSWHAAAVHCGCTQQKLHHTGNHMWRLICIKLAPSHCWPLWCGSLQATITTGSSSTDQHSTYNMQNTVASVGAVDSRGSLSSNAVYIGQGLSTYQPIFARAFFSSAFFSLCSCAVSGNHKSKHCF